MGTRQNFIVAGGITVDTSTLFVDDPNNRVGIATTGPQYTLDVNGTLRVSTGLIGPTSDGAPSNSIADGAIVVDTTNNTLYFRSGSVWRTVTGGGSSSDSFKTISVSGQSDVVADSSTDTLTLSGIQNVSITTNATTDTITFAGSQDPSFHTVTSNGAGDDVFVISATNSHANTKVSIDNTTAGGREYRIYNTGTGSAIGTAGSFIIYDADATAVRLTIASDGTVTIPGQIVNSVTTGTAPFTVASTTVVTNLNADKLDGQDGSYYQNASNLNAGTLPAGQFPALTGDITTTAGSLTTAIAAGVIVNADINASAAIADTKLGTISTADKVSLSALNIDGGTDIGAALVDADLIIVDDGGAGTNRKAAVTRITDYVFGKVSGDITIASNGSASIAANSVTLGTDTTGNYVATVAGTTDQVNVSGSGSETAAVTLSLPQSIATTSTPTFGSVTLSAASGAKATLSGATSNWVEWGSAGSAAPAFTTRSAGTKLVLNPTLAAAAVDYGFGIESSTLWASVDTTSSSFKWYGGTTLAATLSGTGNLTLVGDLAVNGADITTTATGTATIFNTNATTLNVGGAATTVSIGAATGTTTVNNNMTVTGNLTVNGTTTTMNSTTITVDDKNIELGSVASPTDTTADGGGITLKGATDKTFNWVDATDAWTSSEHLNLASGKAYYINGTSVLSSTTLGSGVTGSSLTSVGTIGTGTWQGTVVSPTYGGTGINNGSKTITLGGSITFSGPNPVTFTSSDTTSVTLPTSGTLATTSNKLSAFAATTPAELQTTVSGLAHDDQLVLASIIFGR